jgi:hypothetical protein
MGKTMVLGFFKFHKSGHWWDLKDLKANDTPLKSQPRDHGHPQIFSQIIPS